MNWRPAHEWRGTRQYWFTNASLMSMEMSRMAAEAIYRCFNLVPILALPDNDRDGKRW